MTGINSIMNLAGQALMTQQKAINVTGNNIANVNTPGYSRQRLIMENQTPFPSTIGPMGSGVEAVEIERIYDRFLGVQINTESEALGRWEAQKDALGIVEVIFDETGDYGLSRSLSDFWTAWQELTNNPSGYNERLIVRARGEVLANTFQRIHSDLADAKKGIDADIGGTVEEINQLTLQIADLNQKIMETETGGYSANDYRDRRDLALRELAQLIDINVFEDANGTANVSMANGRTLVQGPNQRLLATQPDATGVRDVLWINSDGTPVTVTGDILSGKLKGLLETRDVTLADYMSRLETLARTFVNEINRGHTGGFDLNGSPGLYFFTGGTAGAMVSPTSTLSITAEDSLSGTFTITLVGGGTAGSETVTDVAGGIQVAIEDGVSTGAQIAAAIAAHTSISQAVASVPGAVWSLGSGSDSLVLSGDLSAAGIEVNPAIFSDLDLIAAAASSAGAPGDGGNAIAMWNLQNAATMSGNSQTFEEYYHSLVSDVGRKIQTTDATYRHQSEMLVQLENRRESISGVSLDEEMMNLVKFQHAYDAAAKLIATADELMQTVLNMI